ncbi:MAG: 2-polyprenyl-3-methyl-6-methoxy-1,4-benzoquinone monooxygenase [Burkholderiaceae bacterium]|nr:2-polyprenyl-3-methyl-6-methoxy-1,4-benzoquinone monooxygenase [Burkholderiaceae bacterium]
MLDPLIIAADRALRTLSGGITAARPTPRPMTAGTPLSHPRSAAEDDSALSEAEKTLSGALMRVNHVGEVCAQALYQAQAITSSDPVIRRQLEAAARDETDHLAWTQQRLDELGARVSLLNPLWYAGSFAMGWVAGRLGDKWSLGFLAETERQVEQHLAGHMDRLPAGDQRSRAIVQQMKIDEARHASEAQQAGAAELPAAVRWGMRALSQVMTRTAHHL